MLWVAILGVALIAATILLHVSGTVIWAHFVLQRHGNKRGPNVSIHQLKIRALIHAFFTTTIVVLVLHVLEVLLWAVTYWVLPTGESLQTIYDCAYFSIVTYTTLGYGDVVIDDHLWRLLPGIQAMGGMLVFGWSSALLFTAAQHVLPRGGAGE